ncbi:MAG: GNAT family N-acetyltransferase [Solobacterium sp.]|nr:GNAT family N-acetyltransferase [Solobacterium sp.]
MKAIDNNHLTVLREADLKEEAGVFFAMYERYIEEENDPSRIEYLKSGQAYRDIREALGRKERPCQLFWIGERSGFMIICHETDYIRLAEMFVGKEKRGNGLAERALKELAALFPRQTVRLTPSEKAKSLYRRCGFQETEDVYEDNGQRIWQRKPMQG